MEAEILSSMANLGPMGVIAAILFWAFKQHLAANKEFNAKLLEESKEDRAAFREEFKALRVETREELRLVRDEIAALRSK